MVSEFVLEPLHIGATTLRFFAPVKPDGLDVVSALLTWREMSEQRQHYAQAVTDERNPEDALYDAAQELHNNFKENLSLEGVSASLLRSLQRDYFEDHPHVEIQYWLSVLVERNTNRAQATVLH